MKKIKKQKPQTHKKRSLARLMAIQIFYQHGFFGDQKKLETIKEDVIENYLIDPEENLSSYRKNIDEAFLDKLIFGLESDIKKIDEEIAYFLKEGWSLDRLDPVLHQILRLAAFELKFLKDVPVKTVIGEYLEITASFFDEKKISFANGVLESVARKFRKEEFLKIKENE